MKPVSGKEFAKVLEKNGWRLNRISGSHHIYVKSGTIAHISLPIHGHSDLKPGLQRHFMKVAHLTENDF